MRYNDNKYRLFMLKRKEVSIMTPEEKKKVIEFLYDEKNIQECENCPYNDGFDSSASGNRFPCGQYRCWVEIHSAKKSPENYDED